MATDDRRGATVEQRASLGGIVAVVFFAGIAVAAAVTIGYRQNQGASAPAKANTVVMAQIAFNPKTLTAAKGSEIVFENKDVAPHNVTADDPQISSGTIAPGKTFRLVVQQPFDYRCTIHPGMDAKVVLAG
jgi:plastocyanin